MVMSQIADRERVDEDQWEFVFDEVQKLNFVLDRYEAGVRCQPVNERATHVKH